MGGVEGNPGRFILLILLGAGVAGNVEHDDEGNDVDEEVDVTCGRGTEIFNIELVIIFVGVFYYNLLFHYISYLLF